MHQRATRPPRRRTTGTLGGMSDRATGAPYRLIDERLTARLGGRHDGEIVVVSVVRGSIERDRRVERARVLIAAVELAEMPVGTADAVAAARAHPVDAIDCHEPAVARSGILSQGAGRGLGQAGQRAR